jgi:hypothetical protein
MAHNACWLSANVRRVSLLNVCASRPTITNDRETSLNNKELRQQERRVVVV